jgi:hypothetical protein
MANLRTKVKPWANQLEMLDRLTRLESRIVQLMYYLGADPNGRYQPIPLVKPLYRDLPE